MLRINKVFQMTEIKVCFDTSFKLGRLKRTTDVDYVLYNFLKNMSKYYAVCVYIYIYACVIIYYINRCQSPIISSLWG